jgi:hypothetical protein
MILVTQALQQLDHVGREWGLEAQPLSGGGVIKCQCRGVEGGA